MGAQHASPAAVGAGPARGCCFLIQLRASSSLQLHLAYRPNIAQQHEFTLPLAIQQCSGTSSCNGSTPGPAHNSAASQSAAQSAVTGSSCTQATHSSLDVPVSAMGVEPRLLLSRETLDFGTVVSRPPLGGIRSTHCMQACVRNNTNVPLTLTVGEVQVVLPSAQQGSCGDGNACSSSSSTSSTQPSLPACRPFQLEGATPNTPLVLTPEEALCFSVRFMPRDASAYEGSVPLYLNGADAHDSSKVLSPYIVLKLIGQGTLPRLTFSTEHCLLPLVRSRSVQLTMHVPAMQIHKKSCYILHNDQCLCVYGMRGVDKG